jgi:hypothetical protein
MTLRLQGRPAFRAALATSSCILLGALAPAVAQSDFGIVPGSFTASVNQAPLPGSPPGTLGPLDTQAGGHPYSATTGFTFNSTSDPAVPDQNVKDVIVNLPAGFIGDPLAVPQCPRANANDAACPIDSQVGVAEVTLNGGPYTFPVFDVVPSAGEPADFEFTAIDVPVHIATRVRTGADYGVTTVSADVSERQPINAVRLTFWGVPADASHDPERGRYCSPQGGCGRGGQTFTGVAVKPFLTNPTLCGPPLTTTLSADSWQSSGNFVTAETTTPTGPTGCGELSFKPSITLKPDTTAANAPTGLTVDVDVPQNDDPNGLAEPDLRNAVVTLPTGMTVNPAAADGLQACSSVQIDLSSAAPANCPDASKIGSVEIDTPLLDHVLPGSVYLATQSDNPFGSLLAIYIVVDDPQSGVVVKLAGHVVADPNTGQLTTTFDNNPQLPFSDLKLDLFGGSRAALATPTTCGAFPTTSALTPWSAPASGPDATPSDSFTINSGPNGTRCASDLAQLPFGPTFTAGTLNPAAGAFSPFSLTLSRVDQDQALAAVSVRTPAGLLAKLAGVPLCPEPQAAQGACSQASQIGHVMVGAGAGPTPVFVPQAGKPQDPVYLTGPYRGAPFGLSFVVPAEAGPFNLGTVVVRAAINVDPHTAQITINSDPLPVILQGIPLQVRTVRVTVDRPAFMLNPTSCTPMSVDGTITSAQGASAGVSSRFQVANCTGLSFQPRFSASTQGATSKANGASLVVRVATNQGPTADPASAAEVNIKKVDVSLPLALPSRLTTLQKACGEAQFASNPAGCPAGSDVGTAVARTPILPVPLEGPAYLVSHGGAAFPDLVIVLQGDGIVINLTGNTQITKGVTYSRFETVPDAPISSFELRLPEGPYSALAANKNLCAPTKTVTVRKRISRRINGRVVHPLKTVQMSVSEQLLMPTTITAQNGAVVHQTTKLAVTGCRSHAAKKKVERRRTRGGPKRQGR